MAWPRLSSAACALLLVACGEPPERPRNLLVVCVDTLRADELGAYGAAPSRTPALDRLAQESVLFERAHAAASWTLPSVAALFTSLYPSTTELWTFESRLSDSVTTLAERFRAAGYATHGIASHVFFDGKYGLQQGFASFDDELCHRKGEPGWQPMTSPEVSARAIRWLEQRRPDGAPWLLFVHFFDPHLDYLDHEAADPADTRRSERERYQSEIAFTDRHVGAVLAALERAGLAAGTNVLFFSDHGEAFEEHPGIRRHSYSLYEEELRVPLFLRVPGVAPRRVAEPVRTVDLLPTLLELHGLAAPEVAEGASLVPLLGGGTREPAPQLAEIRLKDDHHANALVRGRHKLVEDVSRGRFLLFDLEADPHEQHDLAADEPARVAELTAELRARIRAAEEKRTLFGAAGQVQHTPEELAHLEALGYAGADAEPEATALELDRLAEGTLPAGWRVDATGPADALASWMVRRDPSARVGHSVLALVRTNHARSDVFNLCWSPAPAFRDGTLVVEVRADAGQEDQGGGLAWRVRDAANYYVCRYNPLERNLRLYVVVNGERRQLASTEATPATGQWFRLGIEHVGARITCVLDDTTRLELEDASLTDAGGVGLWTKADARTSFAGFTVRPAPR